MKKGQTNNPNGRPRGSRNKVSSATKELLEKFVAENFDTIMKDLKKLDCKDRVNAFISLLKYLVPPARDKEAEEETNNALNTLIKRLFPPTDEDNLL